MFFAALRLLWNDDETIVNQNEHDEASRHYLLSFNSNEYESRIRSLFGEVTSAKCRATLSMVFLGSFPP